MTLTISGRIDADRLCDEVVESTAAGSRSWLGRARVRRRRFAGEGRNAAGLELMQLD